jgi:hypothetical protein
MHYTIYKITNQLNGKIYIGCHKTDDLDDDYMGSGTYLKRSISKHGLDNFTKEYLHVFDSAELMFEAEATLVNEDFVQRSDTYNLTVGGVGQGFTYVNSHDLNNLSMQHIKGSQRHAELLRTNPEYESQWLAAVQDGIAKYVEAHDGWSFSGRTHTDETKKKIGTKNSIHQMGQGNSNYGKCWIHSSKNQVSKMVYKTEINDWVSKGWVLGRKMKL